MMLKLHAGYSDTKNRVGHLEPGPATKSPRCTRVYTFFIISDRKKCFQQKLNLQIFKNAITGLFTYQILIVKGGYLIVKNV